MKCASCFVLTLLFSYCCAVDFKVGCFDQIIDHFNFQSFGLEKYKQRYFYNDTWWDRGRGPIFFFAGHEISLEPAWSQGGFIHEIAPSHKALILFAEHRYYGKSLPFDTESFERSNIGLLSIEQALADYATFLADFRKRYNAENCPIIAFGISYGGMLSAYMRFKYPNVIQGSISASGPIYQAAGLTSGDLFFQSVTQSFRNISMDCESRVRASFRDIDQWASEGISGLTEISRLFGLCYPLKSSADYDHFLRWARNAFVVAAMINFPYDIGRFEAFAVKRMCDRLTTNESPISGLRAACGVFYNASGHSMCYDIFQEYRYCADPTNCGTGLNSKAWDYQACTEVNLEGGTNGVDDMFPVLPFDSAMRDEYCFKTWNVTPRRNWLAVQYWGRDIASSSNIVFSNGNLDPWTPGGVQEDISDTIKAVIVEGGAHHLDLRDSHPGDPKSLRDARDFEIKNIQRWIEEFYTVRNLKNPLKDLENQRWLKRA